MLGWFLYRNFQYISDQFESIDLRNITTFTSNAFYWCGIHNCKNAGNITNIPGQCFELATELCEFDFSSVLSIGWLGVHSTKLTEIHFGGSPDIVLANNSIKNNTLLTTIDGLENMTTMPEYNAFINNIMTTKFINFSGF